MLSTESDQFTEFILGNRRGSRVVRITENKEIVTIFERLAEIINIQAKIPFFLKMIIFLCASGERKFTGVFGISWSQDQGMLRSSFLDQQRDQLAGSISREDKVSRNIAVFRNCISKRSIISIRIGRKKVNI